MRNNKGKKIWAIILVFICLALLANPIMLAITMGLIKMDQMPIKNKIENAEMTKTLGTLVDCHEEIAVYGDYYTTQVAIYEYEINGKIKEYTYSCLSDEVSELPLTKVLYYDEDTGIAYSVEDLERDINIVEIVLWHFILSEIVPVTVIVIIVLFIFCIRRKQRISLPLDKT